MAGVSGPCPTCGQVVTSPPRQRWHASTAVWDAPTSSACTCAAVDAASCCSACAAVDAARQSRNGHWNAARKSVSRQPGPAAGTGPNDGGRPDERGAADGSLTDDRHQFATAPGRRPAAFVFCAARWQYAGLDAAAGWTGAGNATNGPLPGLRHARCQSANRRSPVSSPAHRPSQTWGPQAARL
jgi:hypothetical protein